jgi:hypothetical protein
MSRAVLPRQLQPITGSGLQCHVPPLLSPSNAECRRSVGFALAVATPKAPLFGSEPLSKLARVRKLARAAVRAVRLAAILAIDDDRSSLGLDTMSDNHLLNNRSLFIRRTMRRLNPPSLIEGANLYVNELLITGALFCPSSPFNLLSVGRLHWDHPDWLCHLPPGGAGLQHPAPVLQAWSPAGRLLLSAVNYRRSNYFSLLPDRAQCLRSGAPRGLAALLSGLVLRWLGLVIRWLGWPCPLWFFRLLCVLMPRPLCLLPCLIFLWLSRRPVFLLGVHVVASGPWAP